MEVLLNKQVVRKVRVRKGVSGLQCGRKLRSQSCGVWCAGGLGLWMLEGCA